MPAGFVLATVMVALRMLAVAAQRIRQRVILA